jgi:hypothetical protein
MLTMSTPFTARISSMLSRAVVRGPHVARRAANAPRRELAVADRTLGIRRAPDVRNAHRVGAEFERIAHHVLVVAFHAHHGTETCIVGGA